MEMANNLFDFLLEHFIGVDTDYLREKTYQTGAQKYVQVYGKHQILYFVGLTVVLIIVILEEVFSFFSNAASFIKYIFDIDGNQKEVQ
jgi:hypothetical protein